MEKNSPPLLLVYLVKYRNIQPDELIEDTDWPGIFDPHTEATNQATENIAWSSSERLRAIILLA